MVRDHVLLLCTPKEWAESLFECQSTKTLWTYCITMQLALIHSLMIAFYANEKRRGSDAKSANLFKVLNEGSEDGVNEVAGPMSIKLNCCCKINECGNTE